MTYTVLARRYRSTSFGGVVGQAPIAQTLRSAIESGRVAHAYLFTGTRGVGKTSMARIFARALNAPDTVMDAPKVPGNDKYPPHDVQQRMADAIMRGDDLNVIEIDAASNRSVEEARQLIVGASLSPTGQARFKVYIIDEVHMLTREAFNTLLKTMEEPPGHVKFILCTTEPHRVPATIQSRCQRFDFRHIPTAAIGQHLQTVLQSEKVKADSRVVWQIARLANGSMRDALSLLDRLIATGQSPLDMQVLEQMFGLPDQELVIDLVGALADGEFKTSLDTCHALLAQGISQDQLLEVLIERFHQLMLIAACGPDSPLVELSDEARDRAIAQAGRFEVGGLTFMIALCENLQRQSRTSANPSALLDAGIVRLALAEKMADVAGLLSEGSRSPTPQTVATDKKKVEIEATTASRQAGVDRLLAKTEAPASEAHQADLADRADRTDPPKDPETVWSAVIERIGKRPSLSWLRFLKLSSLDAQRAHFTIVPEHAELWGFVGDQRRLDQITGELEAVLGGRVRVTIEPPVHGAPKGEKQPAGGDSGPSLLQGRSAGSGAAPQIDRQQALNLPLVQLALHAFSDATLLDAREAPAEPAGTVKGDHEKKDAT